MQIYVFAQHYPVPYKSYYDTQFAELLERGHEITIWSGSVLDAVLNEKVRQYDLAGRTRHYPTTLKTLPRFALHLIVRLLVNPAWSWRAIRTIFAARGTFKRRLMNAARALVLGPHAPDVCIVHELGTAVLFPFLVDLYPDASVAMYYHGGETPVVTPLQEAETKRAFQSVDVVFSNTRFSIQHAIDRGCPADRTAILPVGFAIDDFNPPPTRTYRRGGKLQLLSAGRMSKEKGFVYALQAIKLLVDRGITDISYSLTGEGYLRRELEEYVDANGLQPYVRFLGAISTEEVLSAMLHADVLLLPSLHLGNWAENQACAVQETMLMKALVITTATGGVPESIPDVMRSYCVPEGDAAAIAAAIAEIHGASNAELQQIGEQARAFVLERYDVRQLNARLLTITQAAAAARRSGVTAAEPAAHYARV
jgi:colanic acid/amylovoran biosynthesis glycosyltransferase